MTYVLIATLVWQLIDFLRELTNLQTQKSAVLTQLTAWVGGVVVVALAAQAKVASGVALPGFGVPLGKLDGWSIVLVGLLASSLASSLVDGKQAIDANDSAWKPALLGPSVAHPTGPTATHG